MELRRRYDLYLALAVIGMMMLLVLPLNPLALDLLVSLSFVLAVTTLLVTLYTEESLSFSSFPSLLLVLTLFRLGLNIAATRMILTEGQAGEIIKTFGEFVTGGSQLVGFLIFILLTVINFVVITKGAGRVAEVAARFSLDSLPGRQMAIDADISAGVINEQQAEERRAKVLAESDFYGAMDGASKFVRGDAIAGMVIIFVNTIGSFIVGMGIKSLSWDEVVRVYMTLTIGDGLVAQIPALLISVAAGIIVTRSSNKEHLGKLFHDQMFNNPKVLITTAAVILFLSLVPGMPKIVMWSMALAIYLYSRALQSEEAVPAQVMPSMDKGIQDTLDQGKEVEKELQIDPLSIELGEHLSSLIQGKSGEELLSKISGIRKQIASEIGIVVPQLRIRNNPFLPPDSYLIKIKGNEVDASQLFLDHLLAVNPENTSRRLEGIQAIEPAYKLPATWIRKEDKENAEALGYGVADAMTVLGNHLTEVIHTHAHELLNRQEVSKLLENAKLYSPAVVEELVPQRMTLGEILKVLQNLLREGISIRDIVSILEILADNSATIKDIDTLTEYVRIGLSRVITKQYLDQDKTLHAVSLDPKVEQMMLDSIQKTEFGKHITLHPQISKKVVEAIQTYADAASKEGIVPVLLTSPGLRIYVKQFVERSLPHMPVLSFNEIVREIQISSIGVISQDVLMQ